MTSNVSGEIVQAQDKPANKGFFARAVRIAAFIFLVYHFLYISDAFIYINVILDPYFHIALHIGLILFFVFLLVPAKKGTPRSKPPWYDILLGLLALIPPLYWSIFYAGQAEEIAGLITPDYVILGWLIILLVMEAARRLIGKVFLVIVAFFVIYPMTANYFPGFLYGFDYSFQDVGVYFYQTPYGVFGMPVRISSIVIIAFLFFGTILVNSGAGTFFIELAQGLLGRFRGGPAKIAVLASMFLGMITGTSVANVMTTGVFTIPLMKKIGYRPNFSGAVEAVASNGGMYMPPVMGATIFILCDFISVPYVKVMVAAFIPAFLYYLGVLLVVDFEAAKTGLKGLPQSELPSVRKAIKGGFIYIIPLAVLLYLLIGPMYAPQKAALWAVAALLIVAAFRKQSRVGLKGLMDGSEQTLRGMLMIATACASVGLIIGSLTLTGLGTALASGLVDLCGGNLWLLLPLTAVTCYIMGMGMTSIPIYLILAILVAPALVKSGIPPLAAHLFIFYWGITSFITPPVCLSAYAAASISGGNGLKTGYEAMRLGVATYIVPFAFVVGPALVLIGTPVEIVLATTTAVIGMIALASGLQGWLLTKERWLERIPFMAGAVVLIFPGWITDLVGFALIAVALLLHLRTYRVARRQTAL